jgi:hypothetical protein
MFVNRVFYLILFYLKELEANHLLLVLEEVWVLTITEIERLLKALQAYRIEIL